ncbi:MAG: TonB family protein [Myxococcota bacterium]
MKKGTVPLRYLGYSALLHGLVAAAVLLWAPGAMKSAAPGIVRVLLVAGEGVPEVAAPAAPAPAAPVPRKVRARPKPAPKAAPRVRLVDAAGSREKAPAAGADVPVPNARGPAAGEGPVRVASLAPGASPDGAIGAERDRRLALIQTRIQQALYYPRVARRRGIEGTVHVRFGIRKDGRVDRLAIARSSGHRLLDRASLKTIERAQPLPFIDGALEVPVVFRLTGAR